MFVCGVSVWCVCVLPEAGWALMCCLWCCRTGLTCPALHLSCCLPRPTDNPMKKRGAHSVSACTSPHTNPRTPPPQVEKNTGQQYHTLLSLNDCLDLAVERCGIYFRKIEVRPTATDQLVMLLSSLEAMWAGQRKGSTAALNTSSGITATGNKGGSNNSRRGRGGGSSNKRRHNSPNPSAGTVNVSVCMSCIGRLARRVGLCGWGCQLSQFISLHGVLSAQGFKHSIP